MDASRNRRARRKENQSPKMERHGTTTTVGTRSTPSPFPVRHKTDAVERVPTVPWQFLILVVGCIALPAFLGRGEDTAPYPQVTKEAFKARLAFFDYETTIPLEGRVVQQWDQDSGKRQKIVFRGA